VTLLVSIITKKDIEYDIRILATVLVVPGVAAGGLAGIPDVCAGW
jgi:hypothetical protein